MKTPTSQTGVSQSESSVSLSESSVSLKLAEIQKRCAELLEGDGGDLAELTLEDAGESDYDQERYYIRR